MLHYTPPISETNGFRRLFVSTCNFAVSMGFRLFLIPFSDGRTKRFQHPFCIFHIRTGHDSFPVSQTVNPFSSVFDKADAFQHLVHPRFLETLFSA